MMSADLSAHQHLPEPAWEVAMLFPPQGQWTVSEYLSLTNSTNRLVEFDSGRVKVLPMPTEAHQFIVRYLFLALYGFAAAKQIGEVVFAPIRMRTLPDKFREPDIALMLLENRARRSNRFWIGADLVMEVVSDDAESSERDLNEKRFEYAAANIVEYWIVDPQSQQVSILHLADGQYVEHGPFQIGERAVSQLLPDFSVDVAQVFAAADGTV